MLRPKNCTPREYALATFEAGYREIKGWYDKHGEGKRPSLWLALGVARELHFDQMQIRELMCTAWDNVFGPDCE